MKTLFSVNSPCPTCPILKSLSLNYLTWSLIFWLTVGQTLTDTHEIFVMQSKIYKKENSYFREIVWWKRFCCEEEFIWSLVLAHYFYLHSFNRRQSNWFHVIFKELMIFTKIHPTSLLRRTQISNEFWAPTKMNQTWSYWVIWIHN